MKTGDVYEFVNRTTGETTEYELTFIGLDSANPSPFTLKNMETGGEARVWRLDPPTPENSGWRAKA